MKEGLEQMPPTRSACGFDVQILQGKNSEVQVSEQTRLKAAWYYKR